MIIRNIPNTLLAEVVGCISPYPTVEIVTIVKYIASANESSSSTIKPIVPMISTTTGNNSNIRRRFFVVYTGSSFRFVDYNNSASSKRQRTSYSIEYLLLTAYK